MSIRKKFFKKVLYYFAVAVCTFPFMWILEMFSDSERSLPDSSDMVVYNIDSRNIYKDSYRSNFTTSDKSIYDKIINIHYRKLDLNSIEIFVMDKTGDIVNNCYYVSNYELEECMYDVWASKEYREMVANDFEEDFYDIFDIYKKVDDERIFLPSIGIDGKSEYIMYKFYLENEEELTELIKCYQDDIRNISEEAIQKLMREEGECYTLKCYYAQYVINEDFKNTMNFINQRDLLGD